MFGRSSGKNESFLVVESGVVIVSPSCISCQKEGKPMASKDIPLDAPGIPWNVWYEQQIEKLFAEAREQRKRQPAPVKPISEKVESSEFTSSSRSRDADRLLDISPYNE